MVREVRGAEREGKGNPEAGLQWRDLWKRLMGCIFPWAYGRTVVHGTWGVDCTLGREGRGRDEIIFEVSPSPE